MNFQTQVKRRISPTMRRKIDLDALWRDAVKTAEASIAEFEEALLKDVPKKSPISLDVILDNLDDVDRLIETYMRETSTPVPRHAGTN